VFETFVTKYLCLFSSTVTSEEQVMSGKCLMFVYCCQCQGGGSESFFRRLAYSGAQSILYSSVLVESRN
jgi:hypothetical protein